MPIVRPLVVERIKFLEGASPPAFFTVADVSTKYIKSKTVAAHVGGGVGDCVVGAPVGANVGAKEVGDEVGLADGANVGGNVVGTCVGSAVGEAEGGRVLRLVRHAASDMAATTWSNAVVRNTLA